MAILHFAGDVTDFDPKRIVGPDEYGGFWIPIKATYDPATNRTRMVHAPVPPAAWPVGTKIVRTEWQAEKDRRLLRMAQAGHRKSIDFMVQTAEMEAAERWRKEQGIGLNDAIAERIAERGRAAAALRKRGKK